MRREGRENSESLEAKVDAPAGLCKPEGGKIANARLRRESENSSRNDPFLKIGLLASQLLHCRDKNKKEDLKIYKHCLAHEEI